MASKGGGGDSLDDLPEPDYDHLEFACLQNDGNNDLSDDNGYPKKPDANKGKKQSQHDGSHSSQASPSEPPYILGTLLVRVVAARDLPPDTNNRQHHHGIGDFFFGKGGSGGGGSANPYASVKFGTSTQRTSELYDTLDPVWPRGETMFMDVSLPMSKTSHPDPNSVEGEGEMGEEKEDSGAGSDSNNNDNNSPLDTQYENHTEAEAPPSHPNTKTHLDSTESLDIPQPILTVAIFSASEMGKMHKSLYSKKGDDPRYNPSKNKHTTGDSDDSFLGMTSMDLTTLLTGKRPMIDAWVPLMGGTGSVRIVCEYETTDVAPTKGDLVKFTRFCHPADLYPVVAGRVYPVQDVIDQEHVVLSYTSPEGWLCSFVVHRYMVLCVERHYGTAEACRDEWQSITEKLAYSPLVGTVADTVGRLPEEGIFAVGSSVVQGGAGLLGRWLEGGLDKVVKDVGFATNWDGQFNPGSRQRRTSSGGSSSDEEGASSDDQNNSNAESSGNIPTQSESQTQSQPAASRKKPPPPTSLSLPESSSSTKDVLPNMPSCPITSEPMIDPVVAADGHTYERVAIARWLQTSDKSPLTGSILPHKELVPNYGLLSSLQEQEDARRLKAPRPPVTANIAVATVPDPDDTPIPEPLPVPVKALGAVKEAAGELEETTAQPTDDVATTEDDCEGSNRETFDNTDTQNESTNEITTDTSEDGDDANPKKDET